eukprot:1156250-Pelagomonas_calceolata.AAC.3
MQSSPEDQLALWLAIIDGSHKSNLVHMDVGSADRLAQLRLSNRLIPPHLFDPSIPDQIRRNSSRPDAILVTPLALLTEIDHALPPHMEYSTV